MHLDSTGPAAPVRESVYTPLGLSEVRIDSGFWGERQQLNREAIIPHCLASLESVGWLHNFEAARAGTLATDRVGRLFTDSEIYKTMEAMAWENAREPSAELQTRLEQLTGLIEGAQQSDGYLSTYFGYEGRPERWSDLDHGHELYCAGHLIQAAVAVARAGGPDAVVLTARRLADLICDTFGANGLVAVEGHPEIETALVELYRVTGEQRYLEQARLFIDRRGHRTLSDTFFRGRDYYQDETPVREARVLVGHAVRALYLAAGAADVAVETGDSELLAAVQRQYDTTLSRRTYLTGGMGSNYHGESFGDDFELPSERAYAETCAAVASVQLAWRLLLATGEERYADIIERTLYNGVLSSPSIDGRSFFYVNALQRRELSRKPEPGLSLRRTDGQRASWFTTSCCPTNLARLVASLAGYNATSDGQGVQIHQYFSAVVQTTTPDGGNVRLRVDTAYPAEGLVTITVEEAPGNEWELSLRVPQWSRGAVLSGPDGASRPVRPGLAKTRRAWQTGDVVQLRLDMSPRAVRADPRVDALRQQVAVERGPLVYCMESVDQPGLDLNTIAVEPGTLSDGPAASGLPGLPTVVAQGLVVPVDDSRWPYSELTRDQATTPANFSLIPYFLWANRGLSTMRVWLPEA